MIRARLRRVPRPLVLVLLVTALFGVAWALIVPAWGNPDEDAHFAYTQTLAERQELPGKGQYAVSTEQRELMLQTNSDETTFFPTAKPEWSATVERQWRTLQSGERSDNGGAPNATIQYPPAYYLLELLAYEAAGSDGLVTRVYAMRLLSLVWLLVAAVGAWLLAGEVFERRRPLQVVAASVVGLWPMLTFITSSINPDGMVVALWTLAIWLAISLVRRGPSAVRAGGLCLCLGVALVTKASALALIPPVAFALLVTAIRAAPRVRPRSLATAAAVILMLAVPVGAWAVVAEQNGRTPYGQTSLVSGSGTTTPTRTGIEGEGVRSASLSGFASYLWQFYLPKLGSQEQIRHMFPVVSLKPWYQTWVAGGWANFGWSNVWFPRATYLIFFAATLLAFALAALGGVRALRRGRPSRRTLLTAAVLLITASTLVGGLHWTDYHQYVRDEPPFLQGRYLLPILPLFGLIVAQATRVLPRRFQGAGQAAALAGLIVVQIACLGLVTQRFYV